jgi:formylglycine-generating enzyme required for sulfatase activity
MGSPASEPKRSEDEGPQREVTLRPFWMGKQRLPWDEYDLFAFGKEIPRKRPAINPKHREQKRRCSYASGHLLTPIRPLVWGVTINR